jgi:hypothetical protein
MAALILGLSFQTTSAAEWKCFSATKDSGQPLTYCYNPDTFIRDQRKALVQVWVKKIDSGREEASHVEIGCVARLFRSLEGPPNFWGTSAKNVSSVGNWREIVPDSEIDLVRRAVCPGPSGTAPSPR